MNFKRRLQMFTGGGILQQNAINAARSNNAPLWFVPDGMQGAYQNSLLTLAAGLGDPVGGLMDQQYGIGVGGGSNVTQGTAGARPIIVALSGGHKGLSMDGTDDFLGSTLASTSAGTLIAAFLPTAASCSILSNGGSAAGVAGAAIRINGTSNMQLGVSNGTTQISISMDVFVSGTPYVCSGDWDAVAGKRAWVNGVAGTPNADTTVDPTDADLFAIGARQVAGANQFFTGTFVLGCKSPTKMSDADRIAIERFAAYLSGAAYT